MAGKIIVGVSGASGVIMAKLLLAALKEAGRETHLIVTKAARLTWEYEVKTPIEELFALADHVYEEDESGARPASGSFVTDGMIIMPCSMKTLAAIAHGYAENLLMRAADVCLKEGRKVVLVPRETPFGKIHLRNMCAAADLGCAIVPPVLTFYNGAGTIKEQIDHIVGKVLLQFGIESKGLISWEGI